MMNQYNYRYGGSPVVPQYGLGGFLKKVGKIALPIAASFIPGVGGIAAPLVAGLMNGGGGGPQQQAQQQVAGGAGGTGGVPGQEMVKGVTDEDLQSTMQTHIENMHQRRTDARASLGGGMRMGGRVPLGNGGMLPMGRGAFEFKGPKHEQGGIALTPSAEVEGGETMDFIAGKGGAVNRRGVPYIFSDAAKVPGSTMSFAKYHKSMVKRGASPDKIAELARKQEKVTGRSGPENTEQYNLGGFLQSAGNYLGNNAGNILGTAATLAPSLLNLGRGVFSDAKAPVMQQVNAEQIAGPDRSDFGPAARTGLNELRAQAPLRLNYGEAFARNAAATRTAQAGMGAGAAGIAGRLAALAGNRRGNLELSADKAQRQDVYNAEAARQLAAQRGQLAGQLDMSDANRRGQFGQLLQQSRQFNAGQRASTNQFNAGADYQNQVGQAQAEEARMGMINAGVTGLSNFAQQRADYGRQREGNQTAIQVAMAGADPAVANRIMGTPWYQRVMGTPGINGNN